MHPYISCRGAKESPSPTHVTLAAEEQYSHHLGPSQFATFEYAPKSGRPARMHEAVPNTVCSMNNMQSSHESNSQVIVN